ncbi:MAG: nucleoside triphosphate pyrophosphohydrolase [SAR86 cluster bacterium]|uniref:Nucleoside triphosphate pyrophosphohydrolase n=1 Tax=SAR86 cluster bacterium TaxID=2030880 RepID=A0A2A5C8N5_9GAMM|nr:MAG: nucleoside triphosphate pyrophosphohydrolase [SAR86 cluster bacterium]
MESNSAKIAELLKVMALLRDKEYGCAWDLKQTFKSVAPHTLEECYEVIECIEQEDFQHLPEELGDLLFQVVFYAQMASEDSLFTFSDICDSIINKLLTRHPHVFPDATIASFGKKNNLSPEQVEASWEKIKQKEREYAQQKQGGNDIPSLLDDVPQALPALLRAKKLQNRAATGGFDWKEVKSVVKKIVEEIEELEEAMMAEDQIHIEEEFGDLLFSVVNLSRHLKLNPESSLRSANNKFSRRFRLIESMLHEQNLEMKKLTLDELETYWQLAKQKLLKQS